MLPIAGKPPLPPFCSRTPGLTRTGEQYSAPPATHAPRSPVSGAGPFSSAALCGSLGSNAEIRRRVLSCKIGRFVDGKTVYLVKVSIGGRQLRQPLLPHTGHDKGIIRQ